MASTLKKLVSGSDERISRLHTRRGDRVSAGEVLRLPGLLFQRGRESHQGPWMAKGAVARLDELLTARQHLLELGSGSSTLWYAKRVEALTSIEPDPEWADRTRADLSGRERAEVLTGSVADLAPPLLADGDYDVVIIDHKDEVGFTRVDALKCLPRSVQIAVLDDSDRKSYASADMVMADWRVERYVSFRSRPLVPTETTIYLRA